MPTKTVKIINEAGIHCRPASKIMQKVLEYPDCSFKVTSQKGEVDLTSILGLISLSLEREDEVTVTTEGPNSEKACEVIAELFSTDFDFPPRV